MADTQVVFSNHIETLMQGLAEVIAEPLDTDDVLAGETVLVDNHVLGQWLNMQLAAAHDVAANIRYIQPSSLFWQLASAVLGEQLPQPAPLLKTEMKWRLFALLANDAVLAETCMQSVQHYLQDENHRTLKRFQLAASVADLFDQYLIYRPQMMLQWQQQKVTDESDANARWQCYLWQQLTSADKTVMHRAEVQRQLLARLQEPGTLDIATMPFKRLFVFGITSMHPSLLQLLHALGEHMDVQLYVLNPCREYWGLIESARRMAREKDEALYYEIGNPLLASQGVQLREFIELLQDINTHDDRFAATETPQTLLQAIQQEILDLHYRGCPASNIDYAVEGQKQSIPEADTKPQNIPSMHIHQCHSARREVEVLHDQLRDMLARLPDLQPRDIVVMMPKVADYAPYIHAVFNSVDEQQRITYQLTDTTLAEQSPFINSFFTLLDISHSRLPLSEVLSILEVEAVQKSFGLSQQGFEQLRGWLNESGIRWGLDADHREAEGLPRYGEYSWQFGLDRMLSGYAMAVGDDMAVEELLPLDDYALQPLDIIEGSGADLLDGFLQFWQALLQLRKTLQLARSPAQWHGDLLSLLDNFYQPQSHDDDRALSGLRDAINELMEADRHGWYCESLPVAVIRDLLKPALEQAGGGRHHWQEGVKFCSLLPMRAVPFRVVYVLGMNLEDYPRRITPLSFDLMRRQHLPGDRASRIDDRWLFLEALLSARDVFCASFVGRDMHRNETREPSVVLSELIDYIRHGYEMPDGKSAEDWLFTHHALQPFNDCYFSDNDDNMRRLFSFDQHAHAVASARRNSGEKQPAERWQALDKSEWPKELHIPLKDWLSFFTRPWQWFLGGKYRLDFTIDDDGVNDDESFDVGDGLDQWLIRNELIELVNHKADDGDDDEQWQNLLDDYITIRSAQGRWPLGVAAEQFRQKFEKDQTFCFKSHGLEPQNRRFETCIDVEKTRLVISGEMPVYQQDGKHLLLIHTPSKYGKGGDMRKRLTLYIQATMALAGEKTLDGVHYIALDKEILLDRELLNATGLKQFNQVLAELYLAWQKSGLPFDSDVAENFADEQSLQADMSMDEYWYGSSSDFGPDGVISSLQKSIYFGNRQAVEHEQFAQTCHTICSLLENLQAGDEQ